VFRSATHHRAHHVRFGGTGELRAR